MENKKIVIFGGSFNPPLYSHFLLAEQIKSEYSEIEKIIFVPVNSKYQKIDLISNEHRYNMLKIECDKNENFEVSRMEIDKTRQLYTIETLRNFQKIYPEHEIAFIVGSDNLKQLEYWKYADELVREFKIYVVERDTDNVEKIILSSEFLHKNQETFIRVKNTIKSNFSSTFVRNSIRDKKSIKYLTTDEIIKYIKENELYI